MLHVFKDCVFAKKVWGACQWKVVGLDHDWRDPMDWVWGIWETKGVKGLLWFALMGWSLWNARNSAVFKGSVKLPLVLCQDAHQYLQEFKRVQCTVQSLFSRISTRSRVRWVPPEGGWMKVNMDGAVFHDIGKVGAGVVIRNEQGEFLGARCVLLDVGSDALDVESLAALLAVEFVADVCPFSMIFEGDCL